MYNVDRFQKGDSCPYGFRLPSALDNRPLNSRNSIKGQAGDLCVGDPRPLRLEKAELVTEQIIRPTGLIDPEIIVRPASPGGRPAGVDQRKGAAAKGS